MVTPERCTNCKGMLVEATPSTTDPATMERIRKQAGSLRTTPMARPVPYICTNCGRIYFFAKDREF